VSNDDIVIELLEQLRAELRKVCDGFDRLTAIFQPPPKPIVRKRDQRDASGLVKPAVACQASGCMRPSGETAYCSEHEHKVRE